MTELFHGTWWDLHKEDKPEEVISGRFTRLFPRLKSARFDEADLLRLAEEMTADQEPRPSPETRARSGGGPGNNGRLHLPGPVL